MSRRGRPGRPEIPSGTRLGLRPALPETLHLPERFPNDQTGCSTSGGRNLVRAGGVRYDPKVSPSPHEPPARRSRSGRLLRGRLNGALRYLLPRLVQLLSYLVFRTSRIRFVDRELEDRCLAGGGQIIFAGLHEGMMMLPYHFRDRTAGVVMVSGSRDGDIIADTVERFGMRAVRGSSRHGGRHALDQMIDALRAGGVSAGVIVDGPRGPARVATRCRAPGARHRPANRPRHVVGAAAPPGRLVGPDDRTAAVLAHRLRLRRAAVRVAGCRPRHHRGGAGGLTRRLDIARAKAQAALA